MVDGAAVRVSLVCFSCVDGEPVPEARLDGRPVDKIHADLTAKSGGAGIDLTEAQRLAENSGVAFMGDTKGDPFNVSGDLARTWLHLPTNPNGRPNVDVLRPWINGMDLTRRTCVDRPAAANAQSVKLRRAGGGGRCPSRPKTQGAVH